MTRRTLSRLEKVNPRDIWPSESGSFTPWLAQADNLALLGEALGTELELEAQEKDVGPYRADIVCRDTADDSWVLIENQLEPTDHSHLGQILTYAAGLGAVTVVWIAQRFTDEHRAALDWLNEVTNDNVRFYGMEVEVWRIADSPSAPKFNIVAQPNVATKGGKEPARELSSVKQLQLDFWRGFREYALEHGRLIRPTKPQAETWMTFAIGRSGFHLDAIASTYNEEAGGYGAHELRAELVINDRDHAKAYYDLLLRQKAEIEQEMGEALKWYNLETARSCRVYLRRDTNLEDGSARHEQYAWLLDKLEKLHSVFARRVRELRPPPADAVPVT